MTLPEVVRMAMETGRGFRRAYYGLGAVIVLARDDSREGATMLVAATKHGVDPGRWVPVVRADDGMMPAEFEADDILADDWELA